LGFWIFDWGHNISINSMPVGRPDLLMPTS
jgi:hypothetical protein